MNDFCSSQFGSNSQRFCLRSCQSPRLHFFLFPLAFLIHSLPRRSPRLRAKTGLPRRSDSARRSATKAAAKKGQPSVGLAKGGSTHPTLNPLRPVPVDPIRLYSWVFSAKKFAIFFGHFYWKSFGNPSKTAKKNLQNHAKNTRFCAEKPLKTRMISN